MYKLPERKHFFLREVVPYWTISNLFKMALLSADAVTGELRLLGLTSDWLKLRRESLREGADGRVG